MNSEKERARRDLDKFKVSTVETVKFEVSIPFRTDSPAAGLNRGFLLNFKLSPTVIIGK